ncbi:MAG: tRNA (guanosine(46)-N7)-methyltransferase TrmB [Pedosphaera parvula]|nr:tRNA (guanosine(46)-N7)-methyltransferase TrmB [Pedosphaera parvula]
MKKGAPWGTVIHQPVSIIERLKFAELFPVDQPLEMELGSGDGSFLIEYARLHPDRNFIGVERLFGRLKKLAKKGLRLGVNNLRVMRLEASYLVQYLLPANSVTALHIYFPDPWPKRRHHKNRLINEAFVKTVREALAPRGVIYLRTDNTEYFAQMTEVFTANTAFQSVETPAALAAVVTDFERDFNAQGIPTLRAAYQRVA